MINKSTFFYALSETLERIPLATMDSYFENSIVALLRKLDAEDSWKIVSKLLTHPKAQARALGLRVVRRQFRDKELLERAIHLCFAVGRLGELQHWYAAILARYPIKLFLRILEVEAATRRDADFIARHIRALQMHKADGSKVKKAAVAKLLAFASSEDWAQGRSQPADTHGTAR